MRGRNKIKSNLSVYGSLKAGLHSHTKYCHWKLLTHKQVRQLTRLAYIPTCRSPLPPHLWPWPLTSQGHPKWSLWVQHRKCCRFFTYLTSKSLTLIFNLQGYPRSKVTAPIESLLVLHVSAPGVQRRICHCFRDTSSENFDCSPFDLGRANPWTKGHEKGRWPTIHVDLPPYKISARSRIRSTRYALPKFFTFWPLGLTAMPKFTKRGNDLPDI